MSWMIASELLAPPSIRASGRGRGEGRQKGDSLTSPAVRVDLYVGGQTGTSLVPSTVVASTTVCAHFARTTYRTMLRGYGREMD